MSDAAARQLDPRDLPAGLPLSASAEPSFRDAYDLLSYSPLGEGHNAWVGTIRSLDMDRIVAIKIFKQAIPLERKERVRAEFDNAEKVAKTCPYIATIRRPFFRPTLTWLEMDYIPGATLRQVLDETPLLPFGRARRLALTLFEGLEAAHRAGVVHRDIKPENLLIPSAGEPPLLILDFGISRSGDSLNITTTSLGTPKYAPPEIWRGDKHKIGPATDVYSAVIVAYELLAGAWPWHVASPDPDPGICFKIHTGEAGPPNDPSYLRFKATDERETLPHDLRDLLLAGLDQDADRRPTPAQLIEVLRRTSDDPSTWRAQEAPRPYLRKRASRWPRPRLLLGLAGLAAVVATTLVLRSGAPPPAPDIAAGAGASLPTAPPVPLRAAVLEDNSLAITNRGQEPLDDISLALPGGAHVASLPRLLPSRSALLWSSQWAPPLPQGLKITQLQARWRSGAVQGSAQLQVEVAP